MPLYEKGHLAGLLGRIFCGDLNFAVHHWSGLVRQLSFLIALGIFCFRRTPYIAVIIGGSSTHDLHDLLGCRQFTALSLSRIANGRSAN